MGIAKKHRFKLYLFIFAVIVSFSVFAYRLVSERLNMQVELVYDYEDVLLLQAYSGQNQDQILRMLQKSGITSIAVSEDTLNNLVKRGLATWITGEDLLSMSRFGQIHSQILLNLVRSSNIVPENNYIIIDQNQTFQRAYNSLVNDLGTQRAISAGRNTIEIRGQIDNLGNIGLGLDENIVKNLELYKFKIIPRLINSRRIDDVSLALKIDTICAITTMNTVIFTGNEALGYENNISLVAEKMIKNNINFGIIEFSNQKGALELAEQLPGKSLGVHSISPQQLQTMTQERAIDRYVLAAMDRGMRVIYLHAFVNENLSRDLLAYNESFITSLKARLENRGFEITPIHQILQDMPNHLSLIVGIIVSLGIVPALFLFLKIFFPKMSNDIYAWMLGAMLLMDLLCLKFGYFNSWRSALALLIAVISPSLAMLTQLPRTDNWHAQTVTFRQTLMIILKIVGITLLGALFIIALLSDVFHMLKIYQFRGVKIAFALPLMITAFYYFMYPYRIKSVRFIFKRFLQSKVTVGYVIFGALALAFLALYFLRSGNYQLPMFGGEAALREFLGYAMLVRPRTKEFLIGYPVLIFTFYNLGQIIDYRYKWIFYTLATVAPISLLNTFCHLHAPLWVSLLRSLNGLILGIIIGYLFNWCFRLAEKAWKYFL